MLSQAARQADLSPIRPLLAQAIRQLRSAGVHLTDRRAVKVQRLVAAAAVLDGRMAPSPADLWPLVLAVPEREEQEAARDTLRALLGETVNKALPAAAEEASQGPLARATRLINAGRELLAQPEINRQENRQAWQLKLEGIAREIDAAFAPEQLPEELATVRHEIVAALS